MSKRRTVKTAANGNVRVVVPEFEGGDGEVSHCDEFMAGVLARSAADAGGTPAAWAPSMGMGRRIVNYFRGRH